MNNNFKRYFKEDLIKFTLGFIVGSIIDNYFKFKLPFSFIVFGYFLDSLIIGYLNEEKIDKKDILI